MSDTSTQFTGSIPEIYHRNLGPVIFEPYAEDLAGRLTLSEGARVLELACGTGIVTKRVLEKLPSGGSFVASDLTEAMIEVGKKNVSADTRLKWQVIDATNIPFPDGSFDQVVCQFGVMFFPDKPAAAREVRRVLRSGGSYLFNVWDSLEKNDMCGTAQEIIHEMFPKDPPMFYTVPFHYHDEKEIARTLKEAGFGETRIERVSRVSRSRTAREAARGLVLGNPISIELSQRGADAESLIDSVTELLTARFGAEPMECRMSALVVEARQGS